MKRILLLLCFLVFNGLSSQNYDISRIPVNNNNHSASFLKKLYIDNDGFLWYSTHNGVVKEMGGGNSYLFQYDCPKDSDIRTFSLLKSSKNKLWSATGSGINIIDLETGATEWKTFKYPKTDVTVAFTDIEEDKEGNLWLATDKNYLYCYRTSQNEFKSFKIDDSDYDAVNGSYIGAASQIKAILEDGAIIVYQNKKWFRVKGGESALVFDDSSLFEPTKNTSTLLLDKTMLFPPGTSGKYTHKNSIYHYKYIKEIDRQIIQVPYKKVKSISKLDSQNFNNNVNLFAIQGNTLIPLKLQKNQENTFVLNDETVFTLKSNISNAIYEKAGYFLLHNEAGISKIRYNNIGFKKYLSGRNISCRGFAEDAQGNVFVLTYNGIYKLNKEKDVFEEIDNIKDTNSYNKVSNVSYNFAKENDSTFWFYGFHEALIKFNVNEGTFETYKFPAKIVFIADAEQLDSKLMLATSIGLYSFDLKTKTFQNESKLNESIDLEGVNVTDIMLNQRKTALWIATKSKNHSLVKIDYATNIISSFGPEKKGMPIINNEITTLFEDQKNNLWLGTKNGLQKVNPVNYTSQKFTINEGLTNDNIAGILDDKNYLWVSTFSGLIKLNKETQTIQTFYEKDGLSNNEFNRKSHLKSSDGKLYFGGLDGIIKFDPKIILKNDRNHKIFLTGYERYDAENETPKSFFNFDDTMSKFSIPYQQNYLTLKFAINDLINPKKNTYQYRIEELSKNWVSLGHYNTLQLQGLKAGKYNLEVRGFSSNSNQTNTLRYTINVTQVFYKKAWFLALLILGVLGYLIFRNKIKETRITRIYKRKLQIQELKYNVLNAQSNPKFLFDNLQFLQNVMIKKGEHEATKHFNTLSNFLGTKMSLKKPEYILIKDEIEYLKSYIKLENLKLDNEIEVKYEIDESLDNNRNFIPCMTFQPLVEDALINGLIPKKYHLKLSLCFKIRENNLIGEIVDNGVSRITNIKRKRNKKPQSLSTLSLEKRIKIANYLLPNKVKYTIEDIKSEGDHLGTKSILILPLDTISNLSKTVKNIRKNDLVNGENEEQPID